MYPQFSILGTPCINTRGTPWYGRLRHCAANRKVAGSMPIEFIGTFQRLCPSASNKMSTRGISRGAKAAAAYGRQLATLRASTGLCRASFTCLNSRFFECSKEDCEVYRLSSYAANRNRSRRTRVPCREAAYLTVPTVWYVK